MLPLDRAAPRTFDVVRVKPSRAARVQMGLRGFWFALPGALANHVPFWVMSLVLVAAAMPMLWLRRRPQVVTVPLRIEVTPAGISADGKLLADRDAIENATIEAQTAPGTAATLRVRGKKPFALGLASEEEGTAILAAAGLTSGRPMRFHLGGGARGARALRITLTVLLSLLVAVACLVAATADARFGLLGLGPLCAAIVIGGVVLARRTVVLGNDGVRIERAGRTQFLPFRSLADVGVKGRKIDLRTADGCVERVTADHVKGTTSAELVSADALADAIRTALGAYRALEAARATEPAPALPPVAVDADAVTYRVAAFPEERLLEMVEDATADLRIRVAAASALGASEDPAMQERLAEALAASAAPDLALATKSRNASGT